jgi:hypothetical protein
VADVPADFKGQWNEVGGDGGPWYATKKACVVGVLGFDVFFDIIDAANGTREVYSVPGRLDLGLFRTGDGQPGDPRLLAQSWCGKVLLAASLAAGAS